MLTQQPVLLVQHKDPVIIALLNTSPPAQFSMLTQQAVLIV
jgi:hypothetical protein